MFCLPVQVQLTQEISPVLMYNNFNIYSFNLATSSQPPLCVYLNLKEAIKNSRPKLVVIDFSYLLKDADLKKPKVEPYYQKGYVDIQDPELKKEFIYHIKEDYPGFDVFSFKLPLYRYHDRWKDLTEKDFEHSPMKADFLMGSLYRNAVINIEISPNRMDPLPLTGKNSISESSAKYYNLIIELCREYDIKIISFIPPRVAENYERNHYFELYAAENKIDHLNINLPEHFDIINFDLESDFYDKVHVNVFGQEKLTNYLGEYLTMYYPEVIGYEREATPLYDQYYIMYMKYIDKKEFENE